MVSRISGHRLLDADSLARIEEQIDAERSARRVYDALALLPHRDRALMELVALDGLSITDAAAELGVKARHRVGPASVSTSTVSPGGHLMRLDTFEQSLLTELRQQVAARTSDRTAVSHTARRRWTVGLTGGGLAIAAAAVAIILGIGVAGRGAAYAVESQPDGAVVVTVHDLSNAGGLERALAAKGVHADVTYVGASHRLMVRRGRHRASTARDAPSH